MSVSVICVPTKNLVVPAYRVSKTLFLVATQCNLITAVILYIEGAGYIVNHIISLKYTSSATMNPNTATIMVDTVAAGGWDGARDAYYPSASVQGYVIVLERAARP